MNVNSSLRTSAIILLMVVTALSLGGIISDIYAAPLIVLSMSILFFVMGYELIKNNLYKRSKKFIIIGIVLFLSAIALFIIGFNV